MKTLQFSFKQVIPLLFSYVFVGIAFGILMSEAGYSALWSLASALLIYAGSMQIILLSLMASGVPLYMIAVMTFFINARHIFYGIGFVEKFRKMGWKYPFMVLTLTDETYSALCSIKYPEDINEDKANFYIALICYLLWASSCTAGALLGQMLPLSMAGIEFSATAFFITVCVNQWRQFGSRIPAITGLVSALAFYLLLGADKFLLPALSASLIVLVVMKENISLKMGGMKYDA